MTRTDFLDMFGESIVSLLICCTAQWGFSRLPVMILHLQQPAAPAPTGLLNNYSQWRLYRGEVWKDFCLAGSGVCCLSYQCFSTQKSSFSDEDFNHEHEDKAAESGNSPSSFGKSATECLRERTRNRYNRPEIVRKMQVFPKKRTF